jgi:hypothetical protein
MNLIEQLGGYEAAKNQAKDKSIGFLVDINNELLEYRRQQNIFEIGDLYVFTERYSKHSVIHKVDSLNSGKGCIRHATDEEIKAGRRL